jgi:class 3 adenylate cyclase/CHASE2 domain-containing sensor protein
MKKQWRNIAICAIIAIAAAGVTRLLSNFRFFELLNLKARDAQFVLRGKRPVANFELIFADDKALKTFPELQIFWHPYYAEAIHAAGEGGARVIGLDHSFGVPVTQWEPDLDGLMTRAVISSPVPVVCAYVASISDNQAALPVPVNMLAAARGWSGFANLTADPDDFIRRQELIEAPTGGGTEARSFAMRIVENYLGVDAEMRNGKMTLAGRPVPLSTKASEERSIVINYAGPSEQTFPHVSLADVVAASRAGRTDQLREWFAGKIVLIGADTIDDRYATPFYTMFSGTHWLTPGVEIHANTIRTLLDRDFLIAVPEWARGLSLLAVAALTAGIVVSAGAQMVAVWVTVEVLAVLMLTQFLFRAGLILPVSEILTAAAMSLVGGVIVRFATAEQRGNLFRKAVSMFVGKELAASLDTTHKIGLSGTRKDVTILFTDIRGFTAFTEQVCEEQGPEVVVELLNEYMAAMVAVIVRYHGHVNKFIGDGILAVFSDSDEGALPGDHPLRTVLCATEMVTLPSRFKTGAGIHTGVAVVGNVGSADKMEYTVLGDTVNLASRLESLNKENHTKLLMSEATEKLLGNQVAVKHLGAIPVRGKAMPINLFTVASLVEFAPAEAVKVETAEAPAPVMKA